MAKKEDKHFEITYIALAVFMGRKGFEEWWDDIDADIQEEILDELSAAIKTELEQDE